MTDPINNDSTTKTDAAATAASATKQEHHYSHTTHFYHDRDETPLEKAVDSTWEEGRFFCKKVPKEHHHGLTYCPAVLENAIFCGHLMADMDSIAGAIGAAHLYGGTPARASEINSETKFALEEWGCECPAPVEELLNAKPKNGVCLVDFQQQSQLNKAIPMENIVGIIDHHALQSSTIVTERPIFVDIRPWGCMSSILAHSYAIQEVHLPRHIAGMLLSAILSDTLNLRSPTTTVWDERMASMLVQYLEIEDVNELAARQFRAKSHELTLMTPYALVNGDMKVFKFQSAHDVSLEYTIGYGVIETTDAPASLARQPELLVEMRQTKLDKKLTAMLLAVVDIVHLTSSLFLCDDTETSLALTAYGGAVSKDNVGVLELPGLVSRKKDFVPALTKAISGGWKVPDTGVNENKRARRRPSHIDMDYSLGGSGQVARVFDDSGTAATTATSDGSSISGDSATPSTVDEKVAEEPSASGLVVLG